MDEDLYEVVMTISEIKLLHMSVKTQIERWAGGDPQEQEDLFKLRDALYSMILEDTFLNM